MEDWDSLLEKTRRTFAHSDLGSDFKFVFETGRNVHVFSNSGDYRIVPDSDLPASAELKMSYADACLLINRKMSAARALATFRLKIKGNFSLAIRVGNELTKPLA